MDHAYIKTLIEALAASTLTELEFSHNGSTLRLVKSTSDHAPAANVAVSPVSAASPSVSPVQASSIAATRSAAVVEVRATMYGVAHLQASPGAPAYVEVGKVVKTGQTLCVIEAMKIFNELQAEEDLVLDAILVKSGQEVEAGQMLFKFHRSGADV